MAFPWGEIAAALLVTAAAASGAHAGAAEPAASRESQATEQTRRILEGGEYQRTLPAGAEAGADPQGAAQRILEDGGFQRSLPERRPAPEPVSLSISAPLRALFRILLWVALAIVVVVAAVWLASRLRGSSRDVQAEPDAVPGAPLDVRLGSAEQLAAAGRFSEAIHVLLLETLAALSRAARLSPSLTSREIVSRVPLPARARDALVALVLAVELSRFGGAAAGERDYRDCLARFQDFLESYRLPRAEGRPA